MRVAALLAACLAAAWAGPQAPAPWERSLAWAADAELARDPALQAAIGRVANAPDAAEATRAIEDLRALSRPDFSDLVPQLALFLVTAEGERAGMTPAIIVERLGITRAQIERAVAPYRETSDPPLRAQLDNLAGEAD